MELVALTVWAARSWPMHSYRSPLYCLFFFFNMLAALVVY